MENKNRCEQIEGCLREMVEDSAAYIEFDEDNITPRCSYCLLQFGLTELSNFVEEHKPECVMMRARELLGPDKDEQREGKEKTLE